MNATLTHLASFVSRHWLRIGILGCGLLLFSQKQVDIHLHLGQSKNSPAIEHRETGSAGEAIEQSRVSTFGFFGGDTDAHTPLDKLPPPGDPAVEAFLDRFVHVARTEQKKFGVPASITLATALLHSQGGRSAATRDWNSYFGLTCGEDWKGAIGRTDDRCLRRYDSAWLSFRDFSRYTTSGRFAALRQFGPRDHRRWALGLEELGLNDYAGLADALSGAIARYELARYDV